jgi:glycogen operon protein
LLTEFTARLIALRQRYETLRPARFLHGEHLIDGIADSAWFDQHGHELTAEAWKEPEARTLTLRRAAMLPDGTIEVMLILLNADSAGQDFVLPGPKVSWTALLDTADPKLPERPLADGHFQLAAYAVAMLTGHLG